MLSVCSEKDRVLGGIAESTSCVWAYMKQLRDRRGQEHEHYNLFYNSSQNAGVLVPPGAVSVPICGANIFTLGLVLAWNTGRISL